MAGESDFKLRVVLSNHVVKKVVLSEKPVGLEELYRLLCEKVEGMPEQFMLMYEDADFNNSLVSLEDIRELKNCASVTVMQISESLPLSPKSVEVAAGNCPVKLRDVASWPDPFNIPEFDMHVELQLQQAVDGFQVPWALKRDILHKLALQMHSIKAYPSGAEIESVAKALIEKYPCLYEKGTVNGWAGWKNSLTFKMGNFRTKLNSLGCMEVAVNARKRGTSASVNGKIKKPKRNEVNFLPDVYGANEDDIETLRISICTNYFSQPVDAGKLAADMAQTFPARRKEIVCDRPAIESIVERWPALFSPSQVSLLLPVRHTLIMNK